MDNTHTRAREHVLDVAKKTIMSDRVDQYGEPEDSYGTIAELWNVYLRDKWDAVLGNLTSKDVAMMMALLKIGRDITGGFKEDNFVDAIGYLACAYECGGRTEATHHDKDGITCKDGPSYIPKEELEKIKDLQAHYYKMPTKAKDSNWTEVYFNENSNEKDSGDK